MSLEEGLYSWMTDNSAISALVGARVYPDKLPQNPTYEAVVYKRTTTPFNPMTHGGPIDLVGAAMQFDCYGNTPKEARDLALTLKSEMNGFSGSMGSTSVTGVFFRGLVSDFGDEADVFRQTIDFLIMYKE